MDAFNRVVVGLDLDSTNASALLSRACQIAALDDIEVLHICEHLHNQHHEYHAGEFPNSEDLDQQIIGDADSRLDGLCQEFGITRHQVLRGKAVQRMQEYAVSSADLVVVGSHGRHGARTLFGSSSNAMMHNQPCDVLAVHVSDQDDGLPSSYRRILIGVDLTVESAQVIEHASRIAAATGATIAMCHVLMTSDRKSQDRERRELGSLGVEHGIDADQLFSLKGQTVQALRELAREIDADLIVVGSHGKHGIELLKGTTTNAVLHGAECDMLSVKVA